MNNSFPSKDYSTSEKRYFVSNKIENSHNYHISKNNNYSEKCFEHKNIFNKDVVKSVWSNVNTSFPNYGSPLVPDKINVNYSYVENNDNSKRKNKYGALKLKSYSKEKLYFVKNDRDKESNDKNILKSAAFDTSNFTRNSKKCEFNKNNGNLKKGLKKNNINEKYNKIKKELSNNGEIYIKNSNKNYSCNCINFYKQIYNQKRDITDMKQVHSDFIYLIIKYLYYERILPEANEIKRKINKYFPECAILNNNFINICREDKLRRFEIYKANCYEKDEKKGKIYYKKSFNNENICIYLKGISRDFFINPNDDNENISIYIPLIFIHIIDRFRLQSSDNNHKGGRYILAETLKYTGPYIFRTMKLGRIIHILQKCIDLNILSYFNNNIIPIFTSMSISKTYISKLHVNQTPALKNHKENSINLIKNRISYLLYSYSEDKTKSKGFSLSRLPLIYKNVYKENINIDQIGYSKLTEFINNEMSDICFISTQHKFQCILLPVMEDEQKHRDKNAKLKKEIELKKSLDYIKNYRWERCISFLYFSNCLKSKEVEFELEYKNSNAVIDELANDSFFLENKKNIDITEEDNSETVPLLLPLDVFNLPSSYDMYESYYNSYSYYNKDENEGKAIINFIDTTQNKFDIICDFKKCENSNISIEESINLNHMYFNFPSSYYVFHSLFNDYIEDIPIVDNFRIQT